MRKKLINIVRKGILLSVLLVLFIVLSGCTDSVDSPPTPTPLPQITQPVFSKEDLLASIDLIYANWVDGNIDSESAISQLSNFITNDDIDVVNRANNAIAYITTETVSAELHSKAETDFNNCNYAEAIASLSEISAEYSKYDKVLECSYRHGVH